MSAGQCVNICRFELASKTDSENFRRQFMALRQISKNIHVVENPSFVYPSRGKFELLKKNDLQLLGELI